MTKTKSITEMMAETAAKVATAVKSERTYYELMDASTFDYESRCKVLDASDERKKTTNAAIKAVKSLYDLLDLYAPRLRYTSDLESAFCTVERYWQKMQEFANQYI